MKKRLFLGLAVIVSMTSGLLANGLNLNGFGARATAMGGAYVGLADDYTAVFWNPAGLAQMSKGTFGLSADMLMPSGRYTLDNGYDIYSMETISKIYPAGILGFFTPVGDRIVVGVGVYTLSGLGTDWDNTGLEAALVAPTPPTLFNPDIVPYNWTSFIGSVTIAPSIAIKLTDKIFFGATFNINYGFFKTEQWGTYTIVDIEAPAAAPPAGAASMAAPVLINFGQQTLDVKGWGYGATFGLMVKPADWISVGATFRTQSTIKLSGETEMENVNLVGLPTISGTSMSVPSPMWLAGGVAIKPMPKMTITLDAQYTNWGKLDEIAVEFDDPAWQVGMGDEGNLLLNWQDKTQLRAGIEYDFGTLAIRGGYYYDPAPAPDETLNILTPSFTYNSIAAGIGYEKGGFRLDLGLEYLMGQDRTVAPSGDNLPGLYELNIIVPVIGLSYAW